MTPFDHLRLLRRFDRTFHLKPLIARIVARDSVVLDAGCGLGVLAMWAAQAGARRVVAVDRDDLRPAAALGRENGLDGVIEYRQADLFDLVESEPELRKAFDVMTAMVYLNDPRRDERQSQLVMRLKEMFLKSGGTILPSRIEYYGALCHWAHYDWPTRQIRLSEQLEEVQLRYGVSMQGLLQQLHSSIDIQSFPPRDERGRLRRDAARLLGPFERLFDIDYAQDRIAYPSFIELTADQPGLRHGVVWQQRIMFEEQLIFWNESWSWIRNPAGVAAGDSCRFELDENWRQTNCLEARPC